MPRDYMKKHQTRLMYEQAIQTHLSPEAQADPYLCGFTDGQVRAYARVLGLSEAQVLADLEDRRG